jgi:hypothetical protein
LPLLETTVAVLYLRTTFAFLVAWVIRVWLQFYLLLALFLSLCLFFDLHLFELPKEVLFGIIVEQVLIGLFVDVFECCDGWKLRFIVE